MSGPRTTEPIYRFLGCELDPGRRELRFDGAVHVGIGEQAIRYNLKRLESEDIIERISDKIRDRLAVYRFKSC